MHRPLFAKKDEAKQAAAFPEAERRPAVNWASFRGPGASGIGDGQGAPTTWNVETGENVQWHTAVPGLGLSSPVVWGDHVFIEERTVDVHVKRLREALGAAATMVETVRGAGYRMTAQVGVASA